MPPDPWPVELRLAKDKKTLTLTFDDGAVFALPAELLRVYSPSAEVQGHGPGERRLIPGKRAVGIGAIERVGSYAVRLIFDDGHATGIFTWDFLRDLGERATVKMAEYEEALRQKGLARDA